MPRPAKLSLWAAPDKALGNVWAGISAVRRLFGAPLTKERLMIPWVQLDAGSIPGEGDAMRLMKRGDEFSIRVGSAWPK